MELIRGRHNLRPRHRGCVATIGSFDGVHRGHAAVVCQTAVLAHARGLPSTVVTFEPQPREFLGPEGAPARLTRLREKLCALARLPVERVLVLRFDRHLASLEPHAFVAELLVEDLGVRELVVGDDFRFGRGGAGDHQLLAHAAREHGFGLVRQETFALDGERVSSSRVREALARGDLELPRSLLGRPYCLCGRVVRGASLGRTIGFPTANIALGRRACPVSGVFAVRVRGVCAGVLPGMANVGSRPTVDGSEKRLEVHLFDLDQDLYGRHLKVELVEKLRDERRFDSLDSLRAQIARDATAARHALGVGR
jgi:riboflavin kinase/FMN adenylyltransferase